MIATHIISIQPLPDVTAPLNSGDDVGKHKPVIRWLFWPRKHRDTQMGENFTQRELCTSNVISGPDAYTEHD